MSKNNKRLREAKQANQIQHWSVRKLSIGVVSVMLGTTIFVATGATNVHADQLTGTPQATAQTTDNPSTTSSAAQPVTAPKDDQSTTVFSNDIKQELHIENEPNANINMVQQGSANDKIYNVDDNKDYCGVPSKYSLETYVNSNSVVTVTYSGFQNSSFNGRPIKSAIYTFSDFKACNPNDPWGMALRVHNNINAGFDFYNMENAKVSMRLFYDDAQKDPVIFSDQQKGYLVVSSLNNYRDGGGRHTEFVKVMDNDVKPLTLAGSTISVQKKGNVDYLYSLNDNQYVKWIDQEQKVHQYDQNNPDDYYDWDTHKDGTYIGAALLEVTGPTPAIEFGLDPKGHPGYLWNWARVTTAIPVNVFSSKDESSQVKVQEIIHYVRKDGTKWVSVHDDYKTAPKEVPLSGYLAGDHIKWRGWKVSFNSVTNPKIDGYTTKTEKVPDVDIDVLLSGADTDQPTKAQMAKSFDSYNKEIKLDKDGVYVVEKTVVYTSVPVTPTQANKTIIPASPVIPDKPTKLVIPSKTDKPVTPVKTVEPLTPTTPNDPVQNVSVNITSGSSANSTKAVVQTIAVHNEKQVSQLPQTGNDSTKLGALIGLSFASFAGMLGLAGSDKQRKEDK